MCVNDKWKNNCDIPLLYIVLSFLFFPIPAGKNCHLFLLILHCMRKICIYYKLNLHLLYMHGGIRSCLVRQVKNVDITTIQNKQALESGIMATYMKCHVILLLQYSLTFFFSRNDWKRYAFKTVTLYERERESTSMKNIVAPSNTQKSFNISPVKNKYGYDGIMDGRSSGESEKWKGHPATVALYTFHSSVTDHHLSPSVLRLCRYSLAKYTIHIVP